MAAGLIEESLENVGLKFAAQFRNTSCHECMKSLLGDGHSFFHYRPIYYILHYPLIFFPGLDLQIVVTLLRRLLGSEVFDNDIFHTTIHTRSYTALELPAFRWPM